jgi:hypothetical protein
LGDQRGSLKPPSAVERTARYRWRAELVVIGTAQIVWAVKARKAGAKVEHVVDTLKPSVVG